jgi:predicted ester cyclase
VQQSGTVIYRLENGRIAEVWAQMDRMGMLQQLGVDLLATAKAASAR